MSNKNKINSIISGMGADDDDSAPESPQVTAVTSVPRETAAEAAARLRAERASGARPRNLDGFSLKLQVHGEVPGFQLAIMNDDRNRIAECEAHGWALVDADEIQGVNANVSSYNTDPGGRVRFLVGTRENGDPLHGYLMKLPREIWEEDQAARLAFNRRNDDLIRAGKVPNEDAAAAEQRYANPFGVPNTITSARTA